MDSLEQQLADAQVHLAKTKKLYALDNSCHQRRLNEANDKIHKLAGAIRKRKIHSVLD